MALKRKCLTVRYKVFLNLFPEAQKSSNHANPCIVPSLAKNAHFMSEE